MFRRREKRVDENVCENDCAHHATERYDRASVTRLARTAKRTVRDRLCPFPSVPAVFVHLSRRGRRPPRISTTTKIISRPPALRFHSVWYFFTFLVNTVCCLYENTRQQIRTRMYTRAVQRVVTGERDLFFSSPSSTRPYRLANVSLSAPLSRCPTLP